jgi:hypothetical protein
MLLMKTDSRPSIIKFQITPIDIAEIGDLNSRPKIMPNIPKPIVASRTFTKV